jgi:hypothetical protein
MVCFPQEVSSILEKYLARTRSCSPGQIVLIRQGPAIALIRSMTGLGYFGGATYCSRACQQDQPHGPDTDKRIALDIKLPELLRKP